MPREEATSGNPSFQASQLPGNVVRVVVPARAAYNLATMQQISKSVLGKLGCDGCHSGWDIRFEIEREFFANERGEVRAAGEIATR